MSEASPVKKGLFDKMKRSKSPKEKRTGEKKKGPGLKLKKPNLKNLNFNKKGSKFGRRISAILISTMIIPVFVVGLILFMRMSSYINNDVEQNNAVILNEVDRYVNSELKAIDSLMKILTEVDYVKRMQPFVVGTMFESVQNSSEIIQTVNVIDTSGKIIYSSRGDKGIMKGDYLDAAYENGITFSGLIEVDTESGKQLVVRQVFPIESDTTGRARGLMVCEMSLDAFSKMLGTVNLPEGAEILIFSEAGNLVAHSNSEQFQALKAETFSEYLPVKDAVSEEFKSEKVKHQGTHYLASYKKIPGLNWIISAQIVESKAFKDVNTSRLLFVIILAMVVVVGYFISKLIAAYIVKPLLEVSKSALVASGGDFTVEVHHSVLKRNDEFGDLGRAFMSMMESFRSIVIHIKTSTNVLEMTTQELVSASEASTKTFVEIMDQSVHMSATAQDDIEHAKRVMINVNEMSEGSENVAQNTDQLNMLIKNNVDFSNQGVQKLDHTVNLINETVTAYEKIESNILGLQKSAVAIGGITDSIMEIANQTNLLALNAAIEAARAGDAGRGFAVVANEIRNLADQSNKSASNITSIIKEIQNDIRDTSSVFGEASKLLENVSSASKETVQQMNEVLADSQKAALAIDEISAVTEEHAATSAQINEMMESMLETLEDTSKTSKGMAGLVDEQKFKNENTVEKIRSIKDITDEFKNITESFKY